ncbi:hypothetical protein [Maribacter sp. LLG6340-A2]|uniref:hypothetical protein n=1 Tax=Maribacter sp. LLG6340-A2 TaxID=3160834 RepID=UPI00386FA633
MTEIDKINEELRNYKLYKIQRLNVKETEFNELKNDLIKIKKNEVINLLISFLNIISIFLFLKVLYNSNLNQTSLKISNELILNFAIIIILSIYLTYRFIKYNFKLKKYIKTSEKAINYFSNESNNLKSIYENYVDNYLEEFSRKSR